MWKKILLRTVTAVLLLGLVSSVLYVGAYWFTTWRTEQLSEQLRRQRSDAVNALSPDPSPANASNADAPADPVDETASGEPSPSGDTSVGTAPSDDASIAMNAAPADNMSVGASASGDPSPSGDTSVGTAPSDDAGIAMNAAPANNMSVGASASGDPSPSGDASAGASAAASEHAADDQTPAAPINPEDDPLLIYYRGLAQENPDMIGWIHIEDTPVDYPVMYSPDEPQYYLSRDFDRNYTFEGIPFLDARCDANAPSDNLIVYGHNMRSGRMFGSLSKYRDADYRLEYPLISFDTLEERRVYRVYAGFVVQVSGDPEDSDMVCYRTDLTSDEEQLQSLLDFVSSHALFVDPELVPELHDQLLTLSTCTSIRKSERFIVMAIRLE